MAWADRQGIQSVQTSAQIINFGIWLIADRLWRNWSIKQDY